MSHDENETWDDELLEDDEPSSSMIDPALAEHIERSLKKLGEEIVEMKRLEL